MPNLTLHTFGGLFENDLQLLHNPTCLACDAAPELKHPLLPWIIGSKFAATKERVVFVGKPHRGTPGPIRQSGIIDPTDEILGPDGYWNTSWPYWSYTRAIAEKIYESDASDCICMSNLIKCTNTDSNDATTPRMANGCITELKVLWSEIEKIECRTVIAYTFSLYRQLLKDIPVATPKSIREITAFDHRIRCGNKNLGWWERTCSTSWCDRFRILVIGHPQMMAKDEYVNVVSSWIRG